MKVIAWPAYSFRQKNPYTSLLYEGIQQTADVEVAEFRVKKAWTQHYDILHFHWPERILNEQSALIAYFYAIKLFLTLSWMKLRGTKIVWTIHNLKSHEQRFPKLEKWYLSWFVSIVDGVIALSQSSLRLAQDKYAFLTELPSTIIPHGHYRNVYPNMMSKSSAKQSFGFDREMVFLFIGKIRRYKNVENLIQSFKQLDGPNCRLVIAGNPEIDDIESDFMQLIGDDPRISCFFEFIDDAEIQRFINAADVVVLPYREILNSGSAILSLSLNCPVVIPDQGSMAELQKIVGPQWVMTYPNDLTNQVLTETIQWTKTNSNVDSIAPLNALEWSTIARDTVDFFRRLAPGKAAESYEPIRSIPDV